MSTLVEPGTDEPTMPPEVHTQGPLFWVTALVGAVGIFWGVHGVFVHSRDTRPANLAKFFLGDVIIHDAIFAPLVLAGGFVVAKVVPGRARAWVQAALIVGGTTFFFAYPEIRDYGGPQHNPTSLPYNYTANTAGVVIGVCVAIGLVALGHHLVARGRGAPVLAPAAADRPSSATPAAPRSPTVPVADTPVAPITPVAPAMSAMPEPALTVSEAAEPGGEAAEPDGPDGEAAEKADGEVTEPTGGEAAGPADDGREAGPG